MRFFKRLAQLAHNSTPRRKVRVVGVPDFAQTGACLLLARHQSVTTVILTFSKIYPFLRQLREASGEPEYCKHLEAVVLAAPEAEAIMSRRRTAALAAAKARSQG